MPDLTATPALLELEFQSLYLRWGEAQPQRTGLHASSLLVPDSEWCTRRHVLINLFPDDQDVKQLKAWEWKQQAVFLDGWERHRKIQWLLREFGGSSLRVVYSDTETVGDDCFPAPETDLTHYDESRGVYFSPDAIIDYAGQRYVVEIKGLDTDKFQQLTDSLEQACLVSDVIAKGRIQANLYLHLLGLKQAILLIEDKNSQAFKLYLTHYDFNLVKPYRDRWYAVKGNTTVCKQQGLSHLKPRICQSIDAPLAKKCPVRALCFRQTEEGNV